MIQVLVLALLTFSIVLVNAVNPWEPQAKNDTWLAKHEKLLNQTLTQPNDIKVVFVGYSITENWSKAGSTVWDSHYATRGSYNYGVSGDATQHVLWRIENHEFDGLSPKFVVLMIGTNNFNGVYVVEDNARGIKTVVDNLLVKMNETKILLLGITPRLEKDKETKIESCNALIAKYADNSTIYYLDMSSKYQDSPGVRKDGLFVDGSHMTEQGYQVWYETMEPLFEKLYQ